MKGRQRGSQSNISHFSNNSASKEETSSRLSNYLANQSQSKEGDSEGELETSFKSPMFDQKYYLEWLKRGKSVKPLYKTSQLEK